MRRKLREIISAGILAAVCAMLPAAGVKAAQRNSITIDLSYQTVDKNGVRTTHGLPNEELEAYKIADLVLNNGKAEYTVSKDFAGSITKEEIDQVDYDTTDGRIKAVEVIAMAQDAVRKNHPVPLKKKTGSDGKAVFENVDSGMYLIVCTLAPFLISAPQQVNGEWRATATSDQKFTLNPPKPTPTPTATPTPTVTLTVTPPPVNPSVTPPVNPPKKTVVTKKSVIPRPGSIVKRVKTGDSNQIAIWLGVLCMAGAAAVLAVRRYRKSESGGNL